MMTSATTSVSPAAAPLPSVTSDRTGPAPTGPSLRNDAQVIGLISIAHGISHFFHLILAPLFPWLKQDFGLSYAQLGLLMTAFFVVSGIGQALAGFVVDRTGARPVLFFGLGCLAVSALVLARAPGYSMLLAGSMLAGLGNSVFHPSDFTLLNRLVSPARLGHAFSVHGISGSLGWAAAPLFLTLIAGVSGWRNALFAAALLPAAVLCLLLVYRRVLQTHDAVAATAGAPGASINLPSGGLLDFMRLPAVWMCFGFFIITALALGGVQSFAVSSLRSLYGLSLMAATGGYTGYMLASAGGTFVGGFLASRTSRHDRTIAIAFTVAGCFSLLIASGVMPAWMAVPLMAGVGFGSGIAGPSRDLMIRAAAPKQATGRVYGVVYSGFDIGLSGAPLFFGALMDGNHPAAVFLWIGLFQFLAIATAITVGSKTARRASPLAA